MICATTLASSRRTSEAGTDESAAADRQRCDHRARLCSRRGWLDDASGRGSSREFRPWSDVYGRRLCRLVGYELYGPAVSGRGDRGDPGRRAYWRLDAAPAHETDALARSCKSHDCHAWLWADA